MLPHPLVAPAKIYIDLTARCNLRCRYCYHFDSPAAVSSPDLPAAEWLSFLDEAERAGVLCVNISGGEPLLHPGFAEIIASFRRRCLRFELITNGSLLTPELAASIAASGRCSFVQLSFDGPPAVHDSARGSGAFRKTLDAVELLKRFQLPIRLRATIGKHNLGHLAETAGIAFDELELPELITNCVSIENLCSKDAPSLELSLPELLSAAAEHRTLLPRYAGRLKSSTGPWGMFRKWKELYELYLRSPDSSPKYCGRLSGCGAVFRQMGVRADGVMTPCVQLPAMELGRINSTPLLHAWLNAEPIRRVRARRDVALENFPECRPCRYRRVCRGGCPASGVLDDSSTPRKVCKHCLADLEKLLGFDALDFLFNS